jgi:hypothetical protein
MSASAYTRIATEMFYNKVREDRQAQIVEMILEPLQGLLLPGGEVAQAESAIFALNTRLRKDVREKLKLHDDHAALTQDAIVKVQDLSKRLNKILAAMEADISWNRSRDRLKKMRDDQEALKQKVEEVHAIKVREFLEFFKGGGTSDKKEEKKEPDRKKDDAKKVSYLNAMPVAESGVAVAGETKFKKLLGWEESFVIITCVHRWAEAERAVWESRAQVGTYHLPSGERPLVLGGLGT